jgi:hypothetical protein
MFRPKNKNSLFFSAVLALSTSIPVYAEVSKNILDHYGFSSIKQKQAIEFLMLQSGIPQPDVDIIFSPENEHDEDTLSKLIKFVQLTQKHFTIRTGIQERWEVEATEWMKNPLHQANMLDAIKCLGLSDAIMPRFPNRKAIVILGARRSAMKTRLAFAGQLFEEGKLPADHLILLAGERYITVNVNGESVDGSLDELKEIALKEGKELEQLTETDLMRNAFTQSSLYEKLPATVVDTPRGGLPRPTTETTVKKLAAWINANPEYDTITFVSSQPHVEYQHAVITAVLNQPGVISPDIGLQFESIGSEATLSNLLEPATNIKNLIGALGSQIYAKTPAVLEKLELNIQDEDLKKTFVDLFKTQPLIFQQAESALKIGAEKLSRKF